MILCCTSQRAGGVAPERRDLLAEDSLLLRLFGAVGCDCNTRDNHQVPLPLINLDLAFNFCSLLYKLTIYLAHDIAAFFYSSLQVRLTKGIIFARTLTMAFP